MNGRRDTVDKTVARGPDVIALQLDRCKSARAGGQVRDAAVAARGVGEGHDRARMEIAVGRNEKWFDLELGAQPPAAHLRDDNAEVTREVALTAFVEIVGRQHVGGSPAASLRRKSAATGSR